MSCGGCKRVRGWLPQSIRERLEEVERRIEAKRAQEIRNSLKVEYTLSGGVFVSTPLALTDAERDAIVTSYTTDARLAATAAPSPRHLPAIPQGGDGGATEDSREAAHSALASSAKESNPASIEPSDAVAGRYWTCPDCLSLMPFNEREDHIRHHPNYYASASR